MGRDHAPAMRRAHPGLALAPRLRTSLAAELGVGGREIAAVSGDDGVEDLPRQPGRRPRGAELLDRPIAVEVLASAEPQGMGLSQKSSSRTATSLVTRATS